MKKFDLNIDRMLENWDAFHAVRGDVATANMGIQGASISI